VSIAKRHASNAAARCGAAAAITTAISPTSRWPERWPIATRVPGQRCATCAAIFSISRTAISG
jgi:hypothetical protein